MHADPYVQRTATALAKKVGTASDFGHLRFKLEKLDWEQISALINGTVFRSDPGQKFLEERFAEAWDRLAEEYADKFFVDEYNSIKHGFRASLGGQKISFAPSEDPTKLPTPDKFIMLGESKLGSCFSIPAQIEGSPRNNPGGDPHFFLNEQHVNSHPARMDLALDLVAASINNVSVFLRIVNRDSIQEAKLLVPETAEDFEAPWKRPVSTVLMTSIINERITEAQIQRLDKSAILTLLKGEHDAPANTTRPS